MDHSCTWLNLLRYFSVAIGKDRHAMKTRRMQGTLRYQILELMMRFIYTGSVDLIVEIAQDLLRAADQYMEQGLANGFLNI
ncbi:unnamed protein product [Lathyrus sativus]|nr:unnamed protein product [Lathyrus sativus]